MIKCLTCLLVSLVGANTLLAQPNTNLGEPPALRVVAGVDPKAGIITFAYTVTRQVPVIKTITVIENGMAITKNVQDLTTVAEQRMVAIEIAKSRVITPNGKQLPIDEVWQRLKANTVIAMSADGNTPAAAYLQALSERTLVIIPAPFLPPSKKR